MTPRLTITLLGEFALFLDNKVVSSFNGDRPISLLTYLLLHRHIPQSRQQIAFTLWPDSTDNQARTNLRNLFFTLRQTMPHADTYLAADSLTLQWRTDADFSLDVADFTAALDAAKTAVSPQDKIAHLETAVSLYKGDLLPGNYDDWIIPLREELRQNYLDTLHQLAVLLEGQSDYRAAIRISQRLLLLDPLDEAAYVQLMRLHALSGDRAGVRRVYETCVATLRRELDVEPGPATRAAYEELLRLEVSLTAVPHSTAAIPPQANASPASPPPRQLPKPATPFIGREAELAHIAELLADPTCRLLTIIGPGGIGKTRLALETAVGHQRIFANGTAFIDLTPIHAVELFVATIAQSLSMPISDMAAHQAQLLEYLRDKNLLLILDNMEHLLDAAGLLTEILAGAPEVKILATSRQRLELAEEWVFDLPGLPLPDAQTPLAENSAVALFLQTAQRTNRHFMLTETEETAVIRICHLVGGMPLGLQLAATWVRVLSCAEIVAEIERDLDFLSSSQRHLPERQRSMRAVFDYSWQILTASEQEAACRLALFRGGFTREAAQEAAGAALPILSSLMDKALINRVGDGRYDMHELVRQYLLDKLQAAFPDSKAARHAHAVYYQTIAAEAREQLQGTEGTNWLPQMDAEIDNFRAALSWTIENHEIETGLRLAGALWRFWLWRGHWREGLAWLEKLLQLIPEMASAAPLPLKVLANAYQSAGSLARNLGIYNQARSYYQQSLALYRQDNNLRGESAALNGLGTLAMFEANYEEAESCFNQCMALYEKLGTGRGRESMLNNLGIVAMYRGDFEQARLLHEENLTLSKAAGNANYIASALGNLGDVYRYLRAYEKAQTVLAESLSLLREINNKPALAVTLYSLGRLAVDLDDLTAAAAYFQECLVIYRETQDLVAAADAIEGIAILAGKRERPYPCAQLFGAAEALRRLTGTAVPHSERPIQEQSRNRAITAVGQTAFQTAWQQGQQMTLPEALTAALTLLENDTLQENL